MKKTLGRMLTNTCDAYIIPENYEDYIDGLYFEPTNAPDWLEDLEISVQDGNMLTLITRNNSIYMPLHAGSVIVYDTNDYVKDVVAVFNSKEDAEDSVYIPGIVD